MAVAGKHELKFDGYRAIAFKTGGKLQLRCATTTTSASGIRCIVQGLAKLPDETVIDGEVIAFDDDGHPSFNLLQNYGSSRGPWCSSCLT